MEFGGTPRPTCVGQRVRAGPFDQYRLDEAQIVESVPAPFFISERSDQIGIADGFCMSHKAKRGWWVRDGASVVTGKIFSFTSGHYPANGGLLPPLGVNHLRSSATTAPTSSRDPFVRVAQHQVPGYLKKVVAQAVRRILRGGGGRPPISTTTLLHAATEVDAKWLARRSRPSMPRFHTRSSAHMLSCGSAPVRGVARLAVAAGRLAIGDLSPAASQSASRDRSAGRRTRCRSMRGIRVSWSNRGR